MGSKPSKTSDASSQSAAKAVPSENEVQALGANDTVSDEQAQLHAQRSAEERNAKLREKRSTRDASRRDSLKGNIVAQQRAETDGTSSARGSLNNKHKSPLKDKDADASTDLERIQREQLAMKKQKERTWNKPSAAVLAGTDDVNDPEVEEINTDHSFRQGYNNNQQNTNGAHSHSTHNAQSPPRSSVQSSSSSFQSPSPGANGSTQQVPSSLSKAPLFSLQPRSTLFDRDFVSESANAELFVQLAKDQQKVIEKQKKKQQKKDDKKRRSSIVNSTEDTQTDNQTTNNDDVKPVDDDLFDDDDDDDFPN